MTRVGSLRWAWERAACLRGVPLGRGRSSSRRVVLHPTASPLAPRHQVPPSRRRHARALTGNRATSRVLLRLVFRLGVGVRVCTSVCVCVCVCGSVSSQSLHVQKSDVDLMRTRLRRLEEENSRKDRQIQQLLDPSRVSRGPTAVAPGCGREGAGPALRAAGGRGRPPVSSSLRLLAAGPGFCSDSGREKARCWLGEYRLQQDR